MSAPLRRQVSNLRRARWPAFATALILVGTLIAPQVVLSQSYPNKLIRIIVPYTTGGSNDLLARLIARGLAAKWDVAAIVENKPGGSANIGADAVAKSPPDGYTLLIANSSIMSINPYLVASTPFDPIKAFEPITLLGSQPFVLVTKPGLNFSSLQDLIAFSRKNPNALSYASAGAGSGHHMASELLNSLTNINILHVPYKGTAPALIDLLAGTVDVMFGPINQLLPHIKSGRLTALAVASARRTPLIPSLPTVAEAAVPGFDAEPWLALVAPAKTPRDIIARLNTAVREILAAREVRAELVEQGIDPQTSTPEEVTAFTVKDGKRYSDLIRNAKIKAD